MYPKAEPWTWRLYPDKRGGWTLKYRDENGVRHEHTVPPKFKDERPAKKYAVIWIDERKKIAAEKKAAHAAAPPPPSNTTTFRQFAERWTSGELHRLYPDHVGTKKTIDDDKQRLRDYVYPVIGDLAIAELVGAVGLERADEVMLKLPTRSPQTRRHVAQTIHRVFTMAAYPARIIPASPLPKGWLPKVKSGKARTYLYPDEDAKLLTCVEVRVGAEREGSGGEVVASSGRASVGVTIRVSSVGIHRPSNCAFRPACGGRHRCRRSGPEKASIAPSYRRSPSWGTTNAVVAVVRDLAWRRSP
jgi:hypothetical protein